MNVLQQTKVVNAIPPGVIKDDAAFVAVAIDTLGWDYCQVLVTLGATDIAMAELKLTECETSGGTYTDVAGCDVADDADMFGNAKGLPSATDDDGVLLFEVDLRAGRKRYLKLAAKAGDGTAGTYLAAVAVLARRAIGVRSAADRGALKVMRAT